MKKIFNFWNIAKPSTILFFGLCGFLMTGCCPPGGVDRSFADPNYQLAIDFFDNDTLVSLEGLNPGKGDLIVQLIDAEGKTESSLSANRDPLTADRMIFSFPPDWTEDRIAGLNATVGHLTRNSIPFSGLTKTVYQRAPVDLSAKSLDQSLDSSETGLQNSNIKAKIKTSFNTTLITISDHFLCALSSLKELILPSAQAFSCRVKNGSLQTFRPGTLIELEMSER